MIRLLLKIIMVVVSFYFFYFICALIFLCRSFYIIDSTNHNIYFISLILTALILSFGVNVCWPYVVARDFDDGIINYFLKERLVKELKVPLFFYENFFKKLKELYKKRLFKKMDKLISNTRKSFRRKLKKYKILFYFVISKYRSIIKRQFRLIYYFIKSNFIKSIKIRKYYLLFKHYILLEIILFCIFYICFVFIY